MEEGEILQDLILRFDGIFNGMRNLGKTFTNDKFNHKLFLLIWNSDSNIVKENEKNYLMVKS